MYHSLKIGKVNGLYWGTVRQINFIDYKLRFIHAASALEALAAAVFVLAVSMGPNLILGQLRGVLNVPSGITTQFS